MATDNAYTTCLKFLNSLHLVNTIRQTGTTSYEEVGTGNNTITTFWLNNLGVIEDTYTLYYGTDYTSLTETTHYTLDLDTGKITLTTAGKTLLGTNKLYAEYSYCSVGIINSEILRILNYAEGYVKRATEMSFADATSTNPTYKHIINENIEGSSDARWKTFDLFYNPVINLNTTVKSNYTTGATTLVLDSASGFPSSGVINIDGNKVVYTSKSADTLTVSATTPSISADTIVVGEVIEINKESEGTLPSYTVLKRDTDYKIDFLQGRISLLSDSFFSQLYNSQKVFLANYIIRASYMQAWYMEGSNPEIPSDIEQCVHMVATNRLMKSVVGKAHISGLNSFNPTLVAVDRTDIDEIINYYKQLNVGTSPFNKSHIS